MNKLIYAEIENEIEFKASMSKLKACRLNYEDYKSKGHNIKQELIAGYYKAKKQPLEETYEGFLRAQNNIPRRVDRIRAIQAMLKDGLWSSELARDNRIERSDLEDYHKQFVFYKTFIDSILDNELREYFMEKARIALGEEEQKENDYYEKLATIKEKYNPFLRSLLQEKKEAITKPKIIIARELKELNKGFADNLMTGHEKLSLLRKEQAEYRFNKSRSLSHIKREIKEVQKEIKELNGKKANLMKHYFKNSRSNKNFVWINLFGLENIKQGFKYKEIEPISLYTAKILTQEYVRWYNSKFKEEIKAEQKRRKIKYNKELRKIKGKDGWEVKLERNRKIIELYNSGHNNSQISALTNVPRTTVGDIIRNQNKYNYENNISIIDTPVMEQVRYITDEVEQNFKKEISEINERATKMRNKSKKEREPESLIDNYKLKVLIDL